MYNREESKRIREEFWTQFGQEYPRKWLLYNTKIKEVQLKFTFNNDFAQVALDVFSKDEVIHQYYTEKLQALENVLKTDYLPMASLEENYLLPEGKKVVTRILVQKDGVNIHNRKHWPEVSEFLAQKMLILESFFEDFRNYITN